MKTTGLKTGLLVVFLSVIGIMEPVSADVSGLINQLTGTLGVTKKQAQGGSGAIFNLAKKKLGAEDFSKVLEALPGVESLMGAAPQSGGLTGKLGDVTSAVGSDAGAVGGIASLGESFSKLGMDPGMVEKFIPIVLDFAESQGGALVKSLLQSALI
jgi:hypothetical protein